MLFHKLCHQNIEHDLGVVYMPVSALTAIGILIVIVTNVITFLTNRDKMTCVVITGLVFLTLAGGFLVIYSDHDLNRRLDGMTAQATKLQWTIDELSKPAVEFVAGGVRQDTIDSLWRSIYRFRTNPALNARDIVITVACSDSVLGAVCHRVSDAPGILGMQYVPLEWIDSSVSFHLNVAYLSAEETIEVEVLSQDSLGTPECEISTWTKRPSGL